MRNGQNFPVRLLKRPGKGPAIVGAFVFWSGLRWSEVTSQPERVCKRNRCLGLQGEYMYLIERNALKDEVNSI